MESSRIFVKNLPPSVTEADFKKHFSAPKRDITDCRLIPKRRIGFVGYKSPEEAADAARYFNRSYLRLSKLSVEIARPITDALQQAPKGVKRSRDDQSNQTAAAAPDADLKMKKRKRDDVDESNPKVREYLNIMQSGKETFHGQDDEAAVADDGLPKGQAGQESDGEYEALPAKKPIAKAKASEARPIERMPKEPMPPATETAQTSEQKEPVQQEQLRVEGTDDDWLRSRTNRLLDLVDPDGPRVSAGPSNDENPALEAASVPANQIPTVHDSRTDSDIAAGENGDLESEDDGQDHSVELLQKTARLFLRNLAYTTKVEDLRKHFASYGELEEGQLMPYGT